MRVRLTVRQLGTYLIRTICPMRVDGTYALYVSRAYVPSHLCHVAQLSSSMTGLASRFKTLSKSLLNASDDSIVRNCRHALSASSSDLLGRSNVKMEIQFGERVQWTHRTEISSPASTKVGEVGQLVAEAFGNRQLCKSFDSAEMPTETHRIFRSNSSELAAISVAGKRLDCGLLCLDVGVPESVRRERRSPLPGCPQSDDSHSLRSIFKTFEITFRKTFEGRQRKSFEIGFSESFER
jgi:hypothetical protein